MRKLVLLFCLCAFGAVYANSASNFINRFGQAMDKGVAFKMPITASMAPYGLSGTVVNPEKNITSFRDFKQCRQFSIDGLKTLQGKKVISASKGYVCKRGNKWQFEQLPAIITKA